MPDAQIPTQSGFPFLDDWNYLHVVPEYTRQLRDHVRSRFDALTAAAFSGTLPKGPSGTYLANDLTWKTPQEGVLITDRTIAGGDVTIANGQAQRLRFENGSLNGAATYDSASRQFTVARTGVWIMSVTAAVNGTGAGWWYARMQVNGTNKWAPSAKPGGSVGFTKPLILNAGDKVSVELANYSGGDISLVSLSDVTTFGLMWLRPAS
ncbi:hypothetical protein HJ590_12130 [Naumannella sp. ID2617S]|nr:hypothetical protein [Naumannella sp. ID2617S]